VYGTALGVATCCWETGDSPVALLLLLLLLLLLPVG
jgi:hypothetical protein